MAMIDYGAVVFKNGKLINENQLFVEMKDMVRWDDEERVYINTSNGEEYKHSYLHGNHFAYIGDEDFTIGFYKTYCRISWKDNYDYLYACLDLDRRKSHTFTYNGHSFKLKQIGYRQYQCLMDYKGDHYNVIFGYGIDPNLKVWNNVKYIYCDKKTVRKIDRFLRK